MRSFFLIHLFLLAIATGICNAQNPSIVPQQTSKDHFILVNMGNATDPITQYFLKELSRGNQKGIDQTAFAVHFSTEFFIKQVNDSIHEWTIRLDTVFISGDYTYKSFDISAFLIPFRIEAILQHLNINEHLINTFTLDTLENDQSLSFCLPINNILNLEQEIHLTDSIHFKLFYLDSDMEELHQHLSVIDDYYVADALMDTLLLLLNRCENGYHASPEQKFFHLIESENIIAHLRTKPFTHQLPLDVHDPILFNKSLDHLLHRFHALMKSFALTNSTYAVPQQAAAWKEFARNYTDHFMRYIAISKHADFYEVTSYSELAVVSYTQGRVGRFRPFIDQLSQQGQSNVMRMLNALVRQWILLAGDLIDQELYYDALVPLENAGHLNAMSYGTAFKSRLEDLHTLAQNGMYRSYLNLSARFVAMGDPAVSEQYLEKAYRINPPLQEQILGDSLFDAILMNLANRYVVQATGLPNTDSDEKLTCLSNAKELLVKYFPKHPWIDTITVMQLRVKEQTYNALLDRWESSLRENDFAQADGLARDIVQYAKMHLQDPVYQEQAQDVIRRIQSHTYHMLLYEAERYIMVGEQVQAVQALNRADSLAIQYGIFQTDQFRQLTKAIYLPVFMEKISKGRMHMWLNDLEKADRILIECQDLAERTLLTDDPEVLQALRELKENILVKKKELSP